MPFPVDKTLKSEGEAIENAVIVLGVPTEKVIPPTLVAITWLVDEGS